ncbi:MAG: MFS transporter [Alphaproteobacteria bacterium]|nr:MFS transporter [Alphaproteobacteria bacterium]
MTKNVSGTVSIAGFQPARRSGLSTIAGGAIGNLIEWYDWTIYGVLAGVFSGQFFPSDNPTTSLLGTYSAFAVGFLMRPVGSLVLSPLGDKRGRRQMLSLTIILMGIGSLIVAVAPSYQSIGMGAPILLVGARLLQGFSAGGEFQGSTVFLGEHAPARSRALISSSQLVSIGIAVLLATGVAALTTRLIPQPALGAWGWRIPFLLGALFSLYGVWLRLRLPETPSFVKIEQRQEIARRPILDALTQYPLESLRVFAMQMGTVQFYLWTVFLPTYANLAGGLPLAEGLAGGTLALVVFIVMLPVFAGISDRIGRKPILLFTAIGFFVLAYPLFALLGNGDFASFMLVDIVGLVLLAGVDGVMAAVFCELFPTKIRISGIGLPYAICSAIFGGTAPLIATAFIKAGHATWIAFYVMAISLVSGIVFAFMPETRGKPLD